MYTFLIAFYVLICAVLITIVLMQSSKGEGLAGVFGGGGGGQTLFGGRTGDVMTKATSILGAVFMILSLVLALISGRAPRPLIEEIEADPDQAVHSPFDPSPDIDWEPVPEGPPADLPLVE